MGGRVNKKKSKRMSEKQEERQIDREGHRGIDRETERKRKKGKVKGHVQIARYQKELLSDLPVVVQENARKYMQKIGQEQVQDQKKEARLCVYVRETE